MSRIPDGVRRGVETAVAGGGRAIVEERAVGGGCINRAVRVTVEGGESFFLKWNADADPRMFEVEAEGLRALRSAGTLRVPEVIGVGGPDEPVSPGGAGWLLMEYVEAGSPGSGYAEALGHGLAGLHRRGADEEWGWERDNFIGSLPQRNDPAPEWAAFWRDRRLAPQLRRARDGGFLTGADGRAVDEVLDRVDEAVAPAAEDGPSLLHGDLWGGNVYADAAGEPVLIDPAVYRGHREVDLAMSELFGGFPPRFRDAYAEAWPLTDGYAAVRRPLYQLYYLLVHVNLFGTGYVGRTVSAARSVLQAL